MLRKWMLALCFCLGIFGCGCAETTSDESSTASSEAVTATTQSADEKTTRDLFAMDTYITLTAYGNNAEAGIPQEAMPLFYVRPAFLRILSFSFFFHA